MLFTLLSKLMNKEPINTIMLIGVLENKGFHNHFIIYDTGKLKIVNKNFEFLANTNVYQLHKYKEQINFCNITEYINYLCNSEVINKINTKLDVTI